MKATVFLTFFLQAIVLVAQTNYDDYKKGTSILQENFDSPNSKWELDDFQIADGWAKNKKWRATALLPVDIDQKKDFEMEVSCQIDLRGVADIIFGDFLVMFSPGYYEGLRKAMTSRINLYYDPRPGFRFAPDNYSVFMGAKFEKADIYLITFRKIGSSLYIYINKEKIGQAPFRPFVDSKVGLFGPVTCDFINLSYLEKAEPVQTITRNEPIPQSTNQSLSLNVSVKPGGNYYGLIVGVSKYQDERLNLDKPAKDAAKLKGILVSNYTFKDSTTFLLLNPTRQKLIAELFRLRKIIGSNDNLLIFFAGHGYWDEEARQGYWWTADANANDPSFWLSNSDVREQIRSIKSGHTLLISDACFSGGIFKTRDVSSVKNASLDLQILYRMPSRRAITSGTMTTVPDQSVFFDYLSKRLQENQNQFLSSQQLFDSFRLAVINNTLAVPQDGVIAETGDEGGDFIFIRKK